MCVCVYTRFESLSALLRQFFFFCLRERERGLDTQIKNKTKKRDWRKEEKESRREKVTKILVRAGWWSWWSFIHAPRPTLYVTRKVPSDVGPIMSEYVPSKKKRKGSFSFDKPIWYHSPSFLAIVRRILWFQTWAQILDRWECCDERSVGTQDYLRDPIVSSLCSILFPWESSFVNSSRSLTIDRMTE